MNKLRDLQRQLDMAYDDADVEMQMRLEDEIEETKQSLRAFESHDGDAWAGGFAENH
jgi:hypothetical protein